MPTVWRQALVSLLVLCAVFAYAEALHRLRRFERAAGDAPSRWFGYARDAVSLSGAMLLSFAFAAAGFPGPAAFLLGASLGVLAYLVDFAAGRWRRAASARAWVVAAAGAVGLSLVLGGEPVRRAVEATLSFASPR